MKSVHTVGTLTRVPNQPKTPRRDIRVSDDDWADLGTHAAAAGTDRTKVIVAFIRWYLHRPGATLPERPRER